MNTLTDIGCIVLTSTLSIFTLFLLAKLIGNRQMSQLSMFDYINGITIGSIAAELATNIENWHKSFTALALYGLITFAIAYIDRKSIKARRIIDGHTHVIYHNGTLYEKNLSRTNLDINEFLILCRCQGYFDLKDIQTAFMESNGMLSILPKSNKRPTNPDDFGMNPSQDFPVANVVIDGKILYENLKLTGKDEKWLLTQLHGKGAKDIKDVMLATCGVNSQVEVYLKNGIDYKEDMFE